MKRIGLLSVLFLLVTFVLWGVMVSDVEQAKYSIVESYGAIEIRDYAPMIVAETSVQGERKEAIGDGFRMIADYIFGNNAQSNKVAMTAPVLQQSEEPQMTGNNTWKVRFVMPSKYAMQTLPDPNNKKVSLKEIKGSRFAVIRFTGTASQSHLKKQQQMLEKFMLDQHLKSMAEPMYAFFNPPWTLPFLRRNEVMIQIDSSCTLLVPPHMNAEV